jgi:outer membrane protein insertion porin family
MKIKILVVLLLGVLFLRPALAFNPFVIKDIRVEGIQRTEAGTVFSYLPVKVGDTLTQDAASQAVKALFATGFFKDVKLEVDGDVLVVLLEERPAVASIEFVGLKAVKKEDMLKALKDMGLSESRIFDRSLLEQAEQELKKMFLAQGYYAVQITTTITPLERNRIGINFGIDEGDIAKIKQINIIGAKAFSEKALLDEIKLSVSNWISWYTKIDQYSKQKLSGDLETLKSFYMDRGFLEFSIDSTQVSISPDKKDIFITIGITEGEIYKVSSIKLVGDIQMPEKELLEMIKLRPGDVYSRDKMTESTKAISDRLSNDGYAFANVNAAPELNKADKAAAFTVYVDPGRRAYVRRINIVGNTRTRDEVIRREAKQMETSWYDGAKIKETKERVDRLGYFDEVTTETPAVPGVTDQVDLQIKVKEKPTGSAMIGAGFSSNEKLSLSGSISQANFFGSGKTVGVGLNTSKVNTNIYFSHTDPYYTIDGVAQAFSVFHRKTDTSSLAVGTFGQASTGGTLAYGVPVTDKDTINFGVSLDVTKLSIFNNTPQAWRNYIRTYGDTYTNVVASAGWSRNTIDSAIFPMKGVTSSVGTELGVPGTTGEYYVMVFRHGQFIPFTRNQTLRVYGEYAYGDGYNNKVLPFTKNLYAGGIGSVRGFEGSSLGPVDAATGFRLGGNKRFTGGAEYLLPMPGMEKDKSVRLGLFLDTGMVWAASQKIAVADLRYSTGISASWNSPFGPLKFSFAQPLNDKQGDKVQRAQFTMGSTF